ncbi:transcriptional repressor [Candidatus Pelagibacter sp.]|nr:transcriptional repressor [Candidatus Pelagibacter sp.]
MSNLDNFTKKLRESGLRPTNQRLKICEVLFSPEKTFHFTINDLTKIIEEKLSEKISLATIYNTVHAFKKKGYLKEISISTEKSYFDTNTKSHHHFFDTKGNELIDIDSRQIELKNIPSPPKGKSIKDINVVINIENDSQ